MAAMLKLDTKNQCVEDNVFIAQKSPIATMAIGIIRRTNVPK